MLSRYLSFRSFRSQTSAVIGVIVVLLAISLSASFGSMLASQIREDKGSSLEIMARNAARTLAAGLHERNLALKAMATSDIWAAGLGSPAVASSLRKFQAAGTNRAWVGVADTAGIVQSATGDLLVGASVKERQWFQKGLLGNHVGDVHNAKLLANLLPPSVGGEAIRFVDFSAPIYAKGQLAGVLAMHGSFEWAREVVEAVLPANSSKTGLELLIFDRDGQAIFKSGGTRGQSIPTRRLPVAASSVPGPVRWDDGTSYLTSAVALPYISAPAALGWVVVAREPAAQAFASARRVTLLALSIGIAAAVIASVVAWIASGALSRPLSAIAKAARDVEANVPGAAIPVNRSSTELTQLSEALSGMTQRLLANNAELEVRVTDRTAALEKANAELGAMNGALERLALYDPLTGLLNRRAFENRMEQAVAAAKRSGKKLSILMVDVDHFKRVNDRFGHETGDTVLITLASLLKTRGRDSDTVARMGGEEFAILLPDTDERGAMSVAEQIVARVAAESVPVAGQITVSIGVATSLGSADARLVLMRTSDKALYVAKGSGRNRAHQFPTGLQAAA